MTAPSRGHRLLRPGRARSYGSLVRSPVSPVRHSRVEHKIQAGETLQGLALKYGVSVSTHLYLCTEQILVSRQSFRLCNSKMKEAAKSCSKLFIKAH